MSPRRPYVCRCGICPRDKSAERAPRTCDEDRADEGGASPASAGCRPYQLTRWADDWVVTCRTRAEAQSALAQATKILEKLGVTLNREKTRIVHIAQGFEFLGFKIGRGKGRFKLNRDRITSKLNRQNLYAIPTQKSLDRFKDQIRSYGGFSVTA